MTGGITPVENSLEIIGLHQCSALLKYIYIDTLAGKVVFALGFILSLVRSLKDTNFRAVIIFCVLFFSCLFVLILPRSISRPSLSTMEERGYDLVTTDALIKKAGIEQIVISPVLMFLARVASSFSNGSISLIDATAIHQSVFLKDPFITAKLWLITRERLNAGIIDPRIKNRLVSFYRENFYPAMRRLVEKSPDYSLELWPGHADVVAQYSQQGALEWQQLEEDLFGLINKEGIFERLSRDYYSGSSLKDAAVRALIKADAARASWTYTALSFSDQTDASEAYRKHPGKRSGSFLDHLSRLWLSGFPVVFGLCLWSVWAAFPFVLVIVFLSADIGVMAGFFKWLIIIKLIPLFWVLFDRASILTFDIQMSLSGGKCLMWDMPIVGWVALMSMLVFLMPLFLIPKRKVKA